MRASAHFLRAAACTWRPIARLGQTWRAILSIAPSSNRRSGLAYLHCYSRTHIAHEDAQNYSWHMLLKAKQQHQTTSAEKNVERQQPNRPPFSSYLIPTQLLR